jgi:hypothetical protein
MAVRRHLAKLIVWLLVLAVANLSLPPGFARAALISTESVTEGTAGLEGDRVRIVRFLRRNDVRRQLEAYGVDPEDALARVESLSDQEVALIAGRIGELPAGGSAEGLTALFAAVLAATIFVLALLFAGVVWVVKKAVEDGDNPAAPEPAY